MYLGFCDTFYYNDITFCSNLQMCQGKGVSQMLHCQGSAHVYSAQGQSVIVEPYWKK